MRNKFIFFLASATALGQALVCAATSVAVNSLPQGMVTLTAPKGTTTYLSLTLSSSVIYSGTVGTVSPNTITVTNTANPFRLSLATAGSPYFVKFLTGNEKGRLLLITANGTNSLTLDTTDDSTQQVSLLTTGFSVAPGDAFEIFAGDTISSIFGGNSPQNPLSLAGASSFAAADWVNVYNSATSSWQSYFYNTTEGYWVLEGSTTNANNTVLYPYHGLSITRHSNSEPSANFVLTGRVAEVPVMTKTTGGNSVVYASTGYAVNMKLSQLNFGANWIRSFSTSSADIVSIWNSTTRNFLSYYQLPDSSWRQTGQPSVDQSNLVIPAGSCIGIELHTSVSGAASYLHSAMPYSLANF